MFSMISLENVVIPGVLDHIAISIPDGAYIGIAGPNGSGKSTLSRVIKGIATPLEGVIIVDGNERRRGEVSSEIGLVLSNPEDQLVSSSIEEDAAFGLENMCLPSAEIAERTEKALRWASLWDIRDVPAHHLSAGQQQMLVIASIIAMRPKYLILDEATSIIDPLSRAEVLSHVREMNRESGMGLIHISHDLGELLSCQRIYIMDKGRIVWEGEPSGLTSREALLQEFDMELPEILKLKSMMIREGYEISEAAVTVDDIADEIARIAGK